LTGQAKIFDTLKHQLSLFHAGSQRLGVVFLLSSYQRTMFVAKKNSQNSQKMINECRPPSGVGMMALQASFTGLTALPMEGCAFWIPDAIRVPTALF
jgi:hypothetical protein